ncbi:MAG: UDP-glucose 4-epimerase [Deltaproteobacteria bacterium]|nr:MAG: UDP-glucose 4-epimerase [Deltaproteobacteria bacterium]
MKILVTGGAGFIGSNVVDGYIAEGHEVIVVDDLSSGKRSNVNPEARFYEVDIRSRELQEVIDREKPEIINHHAAQISVPASVSDPMLDADINIRGFLNLLQSGVRCRAKKVIFISSGGAIYGEADEYPTSEKYLPKPLSPYAVSKYASEHYLAYYYHQYGLEYTVLRYANIYGPRQIPHGEAGVVAIFMDNLLKEEPSTLYHFPEDRDGMVRDYTFVGDVVEANKKALTRGSLDCFNIGTGRETKTLELYKTIFQIFEKRSGKSLDFLSMPVRALARPGDLTKSCLVAEKAREILGWKSATTLAEGIQKTWEWRTGQRS